MPDLILLSAPTTELEAVNVLITSMGESPVASITDPNDSNVDVDKALGCLNEANRAVQGRGWNWNREFAFPLSLAADGTLPLPANTYRVTQAYWSQTDWNQVPTNIVQRGLKLYDQVNHTFVFTGTPPAVDLITILDWDSIPETARRVITLSAVELFQSRDQQASATLTVNAAHLKQAWTNLEQEEDEVAAWNSINGNIHVASYLYGYGAMRRNRGGL